MKFKLIKLKCKNVGAYGVKGISTGDAIELTGHFAEKAKNNPDFSEVLSKTTKKAKAANRGDSSGSKK